METHRRFPNSERGRIKCHASGEILERKQRPETGVTAHAQYIVDDGSVTVNVTIKEFCVLVSRNKTESLSYEI